MNLSNPHIKKPPKPVQCSSVLSLSCLSIVGLAQLFVVLNLDSDARTPSNLSIECVQMLGLFAWTVAQLCIYLIFMANLHYSFKETPLALSRQALACLSSFIAVSTR